MPSIPPVTDQSMFDCPKFESCSAPICPLDPDWRKRTMFDGERVCFYLTECVKGGAEGRFQDSGTREVYLAAVRHRGAMSAAHTCIRRALESAAKSGSRIDRGKRLRAPTRTADIGKGTSPRPRLPETPKKAQPATFPHKSEARS